MEANKELITYCGLYCGDCLGYKGKVPDLARDLIKELRAAQFDKTAKVLAAVPSYEGFKNYDQGCELLEALVRLRCRQTCRGGGGTDFCRFCTIRKCCQGKGFEGCWECAEFETCRNLDRLKPHHGDAHLRNLRTIKEKGAEVFLAGPRYY
jgi:hypothetical protein